MWAETFDRAMTMENIFDIQSELTRQIVTAVKGELSEEESEAISQLPTNSLAAYEAYLHARTLVNSPDYNKEKFIEAEIWTRKALENDPEFALAWALLVGIHGQAIWIGIDPSQERRQLALDALAKASEYGPFLPDTLAAKGEYLYRVDNNYHEAENALRSAHKARPGDATILKRLGTTLRRTGKYEEALNTFQLAIELDPDDVQARGSLVEVLGWLREYERAEPLVNLWVEKYPQAMDIKSWQTLILLNHHGDLKAARNWHDQLEVTSSFLYWNNAIGLPIYERNYMEFFSIVDQSPWALSLDDPASVARVFIPAFKSTILKLAGDEAAAVDLAQQAIDAASGFEPVTDDAAATVLQALAFAYVSMGQADKALQSIEEALNLMPESRDSINGANLASTRAWILAMTGSRDAALAEIERLLNTPAGMVRWDLYLSPQWDFFRDDERFNDLIRPLNLKEAGT
jgi:tetratricopeptide (TPR) repeat protein